MTEIEWTLPHQAPPQYGCHGAPRCDWLGDSPCPHHPSVEYTDEQWQGLQAATERAMQQITRERGGVEISLDAELRKILRERGETTDESGNPL